MDQKYQITRRSFLKAGAAASALAQERGRGLAERLPAVPGVCASPSVSCSCLWNFPAWGLLPQPPVFRWGL